MRIQFVSDLHLEWRDRKKIYFIKPAGDILVLAGDIMPFAEPKEAAKFIAFLEFYAPKFMYVLHVAGNHEYWSGRQAATATSVQAINYALKRLEKTFPNYKYLCKQVFAFRFERQNYAFIGATLWAGVPKERHQELKSCMRDYEYIWVQTANGRRRILPEDTCRYHREHAAFIEAAVKKYKKSNIILITHHKPTDDLKRGIGYETDMTGQFLKPPIKLAIHGHTHVLYDKVVNGVRVVSNPAGYYGHQHTGFRDSWIITI